MSDEEDVLLLAAATRVLLCDREPRSIFRDARHRLAWHIGSKRLTSSSVLLMDIFHKLFDGGVEGHYSCQVWVVHTVLKPWCDDVILDLHCKVSP
ncbi:hypothetical protein J6590_102877 [Homalodisca vitripennis]|nr:hypothetical protein J6590_102877 [Homalodisca vitripennis]